MTFIFIYTNIDINDTTNNCTSIKQIHLNVNNDIVGDIIGNVKDTNGAIILNSNSKTLIGNIANSEGNIILDNYKKLLIGDVKGNIKSSLTGVDILDTTLTPVLYTGNMNGNLSGNVVGKIKDYSDNIILDSATKTLYGDVKGNIKSQISAIGIEDILNTSAVPALYTGDVRGNLVGKIKDTNDKTILDSATKMFYGNVKGNIKSQIGSAIDDILNTSEIPALYTGNVAGTVMGDFTGRIKAPEGDVILDTSSRIFIGDVKGNIKHYMSGSEQVILDTSTIPALYTGNVSGTVLGNVIGKIKDFNGTVVLDSATKTLVGDLKGNVKNNLNGIDILNTSTTPAIYTGNVSGDVVGNFIGKIKDSSGNIILDSSTKTLIGNVKGNIVDSNGLIFMDNTTKTLIGDMRGNIKDLNGSVILDSATRTFNGDINGNIKYGVSTTVLDNSGPTAIYYGNINQNNTTVIDTRGTYPIIRGNFSNIVMGKCTIISNIINVTTIFNVTITATYISKGDYTLTYSSSQFIIATPILMINSETFNTFARVASISQTSANIKIVSNNGNPIDSNFTVMLYGIV